jgi:tRNA (cytidine/uridine-2'-O-)-methyltransferase
MRLALFQPDIAPNVGTLLRLGACLGVAVDVIEPCGFPASDKSLKRAAMDYAERVEVKRHDDWAAFNDWRRSLGHRLVLVETSGSVTYGDFAFAAGDILMLGRESAGTPPDVEAACDAVVHIPMVAGVRSLNVAIAGAIVLSEALRQTGGYEHRDT